METMQDFVKRHMIEVTIKHDRGTQVRDGWEHHAYVLELVNQQGRTLETEWRQGLGIETSPTDTPAEVLDALVSDAWSVESARDFDDWALDFGYDTDSRKAFATYEACQRIAEDLATFLGDPADVEYLATEVERI